MLTFITLNIALRLTQYYLVSLTTLFLLSIDKYFLV